MPCLLRLGRRGVVRRKQSELCRLGRTPGGDGCGKACCDVQGPNVQTARVLVRYEVPARGGMRARGGGMTARRAKCRCHMLRSHQPERTTLNRHTTLSSKGSQFASLSHSSAAFPAHRVCLADSSLALTARRATPFPFGIGFIIAWIPASEAPERYSPVSRTTHDFPVYIGPACMRARCLSI